MHRQRTFKALDLTRTETSGSSGVFWAGDACGADCTLNVDNRGGGGGAPLTGGQTLLFRRHRFYPQAC